MSTVRLSGAKMTGVGLSFLTAFAGLLLLRRGYTPAGLALTVLGIAAFIAIAAILQKSPIPEADFAVLKPLIGPGLAVLAGLAASILAIYFMETGAVSRTRDYGVAALWLSSLIGLTGGVLWAERWRPEKARLAAWWRINQREILLVGGVLAVALGARTVLLGQHPYPWSGDEASVGSEGRMILAGAKTDLFSTGWAGQPNFSFLPTALTLSAFGQNLIGIRMTSALAGTLAVLFTYLFARRAFNRQVALLAAAFLATFPLHLHFSRIGVDNVNDSLMIVLVLWLVLLALDSDRVSVYTLAGLATGLTFFTYVGTRLVLALALCALGYVAATRRGFLRRHLPHLGFFSLAVLVTLAPLAFYFARHPDIFMTRIGQEGIFFNGWLARTSQETGYSVAKLLLQQFSRSTLVFISQPAPGNFFNSPLPYLTLPGAIFGLFGMGYAFQRLRETPFAMLLGWFWVVVFLGGVITLNPPANTRMLMTAPAVVIFIGLGAWVLGQVMTGMRLPAKAAAWLGIGLILVMSFENTSFYFGRYRSGHYFQDANAELALEIGLKLKALGPDYEYYLFGTPRVFANFPTTAFLAPDTRKFDLATGDIESVQIPDGKGAFFAAIPENRADLEAVSRRFPGGEMLTVNRKYIDEMLYAAYILPPTDFSRP